MISDGVISGGMYTKVMTMMTALTAGVGQVRVLNANVASQLLLSDFIGTILADDQTSATKEANQWTDKLT
ncbi:acetylglutamate kinase [compost metagenome]